MHQYFHTQFGFCLWDIAALLVLAVIVIVLVVHTSRQKKREMDFENELGEKLANESWNETE